MEKSNDLNVISNGKVVKAILLSPIMGGILSSIMFLSYLFYTLMSKGTYERLGVSGVTLEFLNLMPYMVLLSFIISYAMGVFLLIPTYFMKKKYELSDNVFWLINTLIGTVFGIVAGYQYSDINAVLVFVVFFSLFCCSLFNASLLTASINMMIKNQKRLEKFRQEQGSFIPDAIDK